MVQKGGILNRFSKVPPEVLYDERLAVEHLRVYGALASSVRGGRNTTNIGQRLISKLTRLSKTTVGRRLRDLVEFGHLVPKAAQVGVRAHFEMASPVFAVYQRQSYGRKGVKQAGMSSTVRTASAWAKTQVDRSAIDAILGQKESA